MLGIRLCLVFAVVALAAPAYADAARAEAVALLPLDADARLEIYGQPVASEIARALVAGGVDVVVVGPKMAMPDRAKLIVDGTISANKADAVVLSLRVRNPVDGTTLATTQATAQGLPNIDKAAAELSSKILPIVRQQLEALKKPEVKTPPDVHVAVVTADAMRPLLLALTGSGSAEPLRAALATSIPAWAAFQRREPRDTDAKLMGKKQVAATIKAASTDLGVAFEIKSYTVTGGAIPSARARVHVIVADSVGVVFDRVVVTDTVLGDKGLAPDALAARTAREVLDILRPHLRRVVSAWR
jgi:hypothetical protein